MYSRSLSCTCLCEKIPKVHLIKNEDIYTMRWSHLFSSTIRGLPRTRASNSGLAELYGTRAVGKAACGDFAQLDVLELREHSAEAFDDLVFEGSEQAFLVRSLLHERYQNDPSAFTRYYISFYSGAYLGVISEWIDSGMTETSEEMALISMRLLFIKPGESIKM